jgi:hypothetical protein
MTSTRAKKYKVEILFIIEALPHKFMVQNIYNYVVQLAVRGPHLARDNL